MPIRELSLAAVIWVLAATVTLGWGGFILYGIWWLF
jgi:hypothetical protein